MQGVGPREGELYRRNGVFKEGVEHMFNVVRWHTFMVDHVTPTHVCGTIITQLILEAGEYFSCKLTDFTSVFFSFVGVGLTENVDRFLPRNELIDILCLADSYLDLFGYRWEEDTGGLLPIEALDLTGLPQDIALALGGQLSLAAVRSYRDVLPQLTQFKYGDSISNLRIVVDLSLEFYLGSSPCRFPASDPSAITRLISRLHEL